MEELKQLLVNGVNTMDVCFLLDDGHGWETKGKRSGDFDGDGWPDIKENHFNEAVMRKFSMMLDLMGFQYELLAPEYWDVPLYLRSSRERKYVKAMKYKYTIMISFHANAFTREMAKGVEVFYRDGNDSGKQLAQYLIGAYRGMDGMVNRGVKKSSKKEYNFHMLRRTRSDARVLIEAGFMTNAEDRARLNDDKWINQFCAQTIIGCVDFLRVVSDSTPQYYFNYL